MEKTWYGIGILATTVVILGILMKFRIIRHNPVMVVLFAINPGLVGLLASLAFFLADDPSVSRPLFYGALILTVSSTFVIAFALPRIFMVHMKEQFAEAEQERRSNQGDPQT